MAREADSLESQRYFMVLVGGILNKLSSAGIKVLKSAFNTLSEYARVKFYYNNVMLQYF